VHAHEVHAHEVHAYEVHAHEVHVYEVHAYEVHAHEVHAQVPRWIPYAITRYLTQRLGNCLATLLNGFTTGEYPATVRQPQLNGIIA
jgi:hypothetical protein